MKGGDRLNNQITFYAEWLPLEKRDFRILAMLADIGEFKGNLSSICRYLNIDPQTKSITKIRNSICFLTEYNYIKSILSGRTYTLTLLPKEEPITIKRNYYAEIKKHNYSSASVSWEVLLKVYLWLYIHNSEDVFTNEEIAHDLGVGESTITNATKVLDKDFQAITKEIVAEKIRENCFRRKGQIVEVCAWWNLESNK